MPAHGLDVFNNQKPLYMNIRIALIVLFLLLIGAETAFAQFGRLRDRALDAAQRRVEQRVEERVNQEIDRAVYRSVDKAFDSVFGSPHQRDDFSSDAEYEEAMNTWRQAMMAMGSDIETRDAYRFSVVNRMRVTGVDEDGASIEPTYFDSLIEPDATYSGTFVPQDESDDRVTMVFDAETNAMIMFIRSDGEQMSMVYGSNAMFETMMGDFEEFEDEDVEAEPIPDHYAERFEEIGTKIIHGVRATGFLMEDESVRIEYWVTTEFGSPAAAGGFIQSPSTLMMPGIPQSHGGVMLEARFNDKESGSEFIMESVEIRQNERREFTKSEYPLVRFGE